MYNIQYGLHDTKVTKILIEGCNIIFEFFDGIYFLDDSKKEIRKTQRCKLVVNFTDCNIEEHVIINKIKRRKIKEICVADFLKRANSNGFELELDFYSNFNNAIMFVGYIKNEYFQFLMTETIVIDIKFD